MANHCVDVICTSCGRGWCARGCGSEEPEPDAVALAMFMKKRQEWADQFRQGDLNAAITYSTDLKCVCGGRVAID